MGRDPRRFRETERRLWNSVGLTPVEHDVRLRTGNVVRVQEVGEGEPVLFVHGANSCGAIWAPLIARLPGFRCLTIDRPGCGLSDPIDPPGDIAELEVQADALVVDVLDACGLAGASVVATSYGGYFAFRGAAAHPSRIGRLVEVAWTMVAPAERLPVAFRIAAVPGVGAVMSRLPPNRIVVKAMLRQIGLGDALADGRFSDEMFDCFLSLLRETRTIQHERRSAPEVLSPVRGQNERMLLTDAEVARITMPVLVIWGEADPLGGPTVARWFSDRFSDSRLHVLAGAGHAPWIDEPGRTAELIEEFLTDRT